MTVISNSRLPELHTPQLAKADSQTQPAPQLTTELSRWDGETPQERGDRNLVRSYTQELKQLSGHNQDYRQQTVKDIPPESSFGQWRGQLDNILKSPAFKEWAEQNNVDLSKEITLDVDSGTLTATSTKPRNSFDFSPSRPQSHDIHSFVGWPLLKSTAKTLAGSGNVVNFDTATNARISDIAQFYGQSLPFDRASSTTEQQAALTSYVANWEHKDSLLSKTVDLPTKEDLENQALKLGDLNTRNAVIAAIPTIADDIDKSLEKHPATTVLFLNDATEADYKLKYKQKMEAALDTAIQIDPASSYFRDHNLKPGVAVTLREYLIGHGVLVPATTKELRGIAQSLASPPIETPPHGNLGGALSWPTPISTNDQRALIAMTGKFLEDQPENNLLDYLTRGLGLDDEAITTDRDRAIDRILKSPNAEKFARAAERELGELASPDAISEWVLTALYTSLDALSVNTIAPNSSRTTVAGYDLADVNLSGRNLAEIHNDLARHLIRNKIASPENLELAIQVLLSQKAPELLVKEVPLEMTKGSHSWVSFATAVARIEAQAPGSTSQMTYAQVMMRGELPPITLADQLVEYNAQTNAIKDWGVMNGKITANPQDEYTTSQMSDLRSAFSTQVRELSHASTTFLSEPPDLHKRALTKLKNDNPHLTEEQLTSKIIDPRHTSASEALDFPGPYSILDLFINNVWKNGGYRSGNFSSRDEKVDIDSVVMDTSSAFTLKENFEPNIKEYFSNFNAAVKSQTKFLISKLPLKDRQILENGKISIAQELRSTTTAPGIATALNPLGAFFGPDIESNTEKVARGNILVRSEYEVNGRPQTATYEISVKNNSIRRRDDLNATQTTEVTPDLGANVTSTFFETVEPDGSYSPGILDPVKTDVTSGVPNSYFSERTQYIADAMAESINIEEFEKQLRGVTTFDTEVAFSKKLKDFALGLIPGYNAITNFIEGDWRQGLRDLAFDAVGFAIGGIGKTAKGVQVALGAGSFSSAAKKLVRGTLGAFNPIDLKGLALAGAQEGISYLANIKPGGNNQPRIEIKYDPVKIFRNVENATIGSASMQGATSKIAATQKNGKWYALDPVSKQPFGLPLKDFAPAA